MALRSHHDVHPWRRRLGLLLLVGGLLGLAWFTAPRGTAASRVRATVDRWIEDQSRIP